MISYKESLKILKRTKALLEGHFVLSSGLHSDKYIQCAKLLSHPQQSRKICSSLKAKISKAYKKIDIILSPAMGGIIVGYEISRQLNVVSIFAERVGGKLILRRGFSIPKKSRVLVVEDVITTGKSALECLNIVKKNKARIIAFACIINRSNKDTLNKIPIISQVKFKIDTFKANELPNKLKKVKVKIPGSRNLSKWKKKDLESI